MPGKIHCGLCLLQGNVAEQWLVAAVGRLHVDEENLRQHLAEGFEPQANGAANVAGDDGLTPWKSRPGIVDCGAVSAHCAE